jgi:hypothetical protein
MELHVNLVQVILFLYLQDLVIALNVVLDLKQIQNLHHVIHVIQDIILMDLEVVFNVLLAILLQIKHKLNVLHVFVDLKQV